MILADFWSAFQAKAHFDAAIHSLASTSGTLIKWLFTTNAGRAKMKRALLKPVWFDEHDVLLPEAETGGYRQRGLGRLVA